MPKAGDHPVAVSKDVFDLLAACAEYSRKGEEGSFKYYGGAVDEGVGLLQRNRPFAAPEQEIREARWTISATRMLSWIRLKRTVRLPQAWHEFQARAG